MESSQIVKSKLCRHFLNNSCRYGDKCKFSHQNVKSRSRKLSSPNTTDFKPLDRDVDLRLVVDLNSSITNMNPLDVILAPTIFSSFPKYVLYNSLINEIESCGIPPERLLKHWHGNHTDVAGTHYIADDSVNWKAKCPTFGMVVDRLCQYYEMTAMSTRFNWYKNQDEWKPLHHDASKIKPHIAKKQNITVAVSFGQTRDIILQHAARPDVYISTPSSDGHSYAFSHTINCNWKHGVHIGNPDDDVTGRVSVIVWGWKPSLGNLA